MRQAIEEGFIMDVLSSYTTYQTFWRIEKATEEDPEYAPARRGVRSPGSSAFTPTISRRRRRSSSSTSASTRKEVGGASKGMVVTSSRLHAVRDKQHIDKYIREKGYAEITTLVAFSGKIDDARARR
ncbi:MAG: hypothetical protein ACJ780_19700 [Solirubrobacteraceae bacterium]